MDKLLQRDALADAVEAIKRYLDFELIPRFGMATDGAAG